MKRAIALLGLIVSCAACLSAENRHAFYLEPDGSATWAVTEEDVRSGAEFLEGARRGQTQIARALQQVGATWVETKVVRDQVPYTVVSQARFDSAARMLESFLGAIGFEAEAALKFDAERTTLWFRFREPAENGGDDESDFGPLGCLVEPVERYRFVLTEGHFVEATGFRIESGETLAVMLDLEEAEEETDRDSVFYSLTWRTER